MMMMMMMMMMIKPVLIAGEKAEAATHLEQLAGAQQVP